MKKFNHLNIPDKWQQYWSRYPQGYTIMEALIDWVSQVDDMVDNQNILTDNVAQFRNEIDAFINQFDDSLQTTVTDTLTDWQDSGFLDEIINQALETKYDSLSSQLTQLDSSKIDKNRGAVTSADLSQEVKEQMTGGSVAVVGVNAVNTENLIDNSVTVNKADFIDKSSNLFNKANLVTGYNLDIHTGQHESNGSFRYTPHYEPIKPNVSYVLGVTPKEGQIIRLFFYDSNKNYLRNSYITDDTTDRLAIEPNEDYAFVRFSIHVFTDDDTLQFNEGTSLKPYENYYQAISDSIDLPGMTAENEEWVV